MTSAVEAAKTVKVTPTEAWSECEREIQVRVRCYDKWIGDGKIAWADARDRLARLGEASRMLKEIIESTEGEA